MGAEVSWDRENGDLRVKGGELKGVDVDAGRTPDLVPTIAVLGAMAQGKTAIFNASVRHKETDRLHAMAVELSKMERTFGRSRMAWRSQAAICMGPRCTAITITE